MTKFQRLLIFGLPMLLAAAFFGGPGLLEETPPARAAAGEVLILQTSSGTTQLAAAFTAAGKTPVIVSPATWSGMTAAQFASYDALALPDPTCGSESEIAAAIANANVWGPVIGQNVVIIGTDEVFHAGQGGQALMNAVAPFVVSDPTETGMYISLSCYYGGVAAGTAVPWLGTAFGGNFAVTGEPDSLCYNNAHIVATHPSLAGLTDAILSNWSCSVHEGFTAWPLSFEVLAIARDLGSFYTAPDGSVGTPYILARGVSVISDIDLTPETATNPTGTSHTVTATVLSNTTPVVGTLVTFNVIAGPNVGKTSSSTGTCVPASCLTNASGQVTWTYTDTAGPGTDSIRASFTSSGVTQTSNTAEKTWTGTSKTPTATPKDKDKDDHDRPPATSTPTATPTNTATRTPTPTSTPTFLEQRGSVGGAVTGVRPDRTPVVAPPPPALPAAPARVISPPNTGEGGLLP